MAVDVIQDATLRIADDQNVEITFVCSLPQEKQEIMIDKGRINEVLINLLDNAINFTDKGTISVRLEESKQSPDNNFIQVKVADGGRGIDESIKDKLFQKFVTKSDRARGTGLGLYICKGIVEAYGGKIWAENNEDNRDGKKVQRSHLNFPYRTAQLTAFASARSELRLYFDI